MGNRFHGIIAPITTPFSEEGELLSDALVRNLTRYSSTPLSGFLVAGSTGESPHLSEEERLALIRRASEAVEPGKSFLVGVPGTSLRQAEQLISKLSGFAIDALLVSVPSYYKNRMDEASLRTYYEGLAERSPFPLLLYNIPRYSGLELTPSLVSVLSGHPNIVGMKDSSGNLIYVQEILSRTRDADFQLIGGSAETFLPAMNFGVTAGILAVACVIPEEVCELFLAFQRDSETLLKKNQFVFSVSQALVARLGVAGVKYGMDLCGYAGLASRWPLRPLNDAEKADVRAVLGRD